MRRIMYKNHFKGDMNMKKFTWLAVLVLIALVLGSIGIVQAEIRKPYGPGQIGYTAVVLCEKLTVREKPSSSAKALKTIPYGRHMAVAKTSNGWAQIFLSDDVDAEPAGWVNGDYIVIDPAWYVTEKKTPVYAWNDTGAPKVALLDPDTTLPILKQDKNWIVVSLRGASGWIRKTAND